MIPEAFGPQLLNCPGTNTRTGGVTLGSNT